MLKAALERAESRGAHYRTDHAESAEEWRVNLAVTDDGRNSSTTTSSERRRSPAAER